MRFGTRLIVVAAAIVLLASTAYAQSNKIVIAAQPDIILPYHVAVDKGLFKAAGLDAQEAFFESGAAMLQSFIADKIDVGYMGLAPAVIAYTQGAPVEIIMVNHVSHSERLVVRPDAGIKSLKDLKGKTIAVTQGTSAFFALSKALERVGMTPADVNVLNMSPAAMGPAFSERKIHGAWVWEPTSSVLNDLGGVTLTTSAAAIGTAPPAVWLARTRFVKDNPGAVQKFLRAMDTAIGFYQTNKREALEMMAKHLGRTPEQVEALVTRAEVRYLPISEQSKPAWLGGKPGDETPLIRLGKSFALFLKAQGKVNVVPDDWSKFVNAQPVQAYTSAKGK